MLPKKQYYTVHIACVFKKKVLIREMGWRFKREGTYVYLWLVHVVVWWKPTKFCTAIILQ